VMIREIIGHITFDIFHLLFWDAGGLK
jgi:hypothetical protein